MPSKKTIPCSQHEEQGITGFSSSDAVLHQHKNQHMDGVKRIAGILERLAVVALPTAIQPDG